MKKKVLSIAAILLVAGTIIFANTPKKAGCCTQGSACCHHGSACCHK